MVEIADGDTPSLVWGQWLGGTGTDHVYALAVTGDEIYAGGYSNTSASFESVTFQGIASGVEGFVVEIGDADTQLWLGASGWGGRVLIMFMPWP